MHAIMIRPAGFKAVWPTLKQSDNSITARLVIGLQCLHICRHCPLHQLSAANYIHMYASSTYCLSCPKLWALTVAMDVTYIHVHVRMVYLFILLWSCVYVDTYTLCCVACGDFSSTH